MAALTAPTTLRPVDAAYCRMMKMIAAAVTVVPGVAVKISGNRTCAIADKDALADGNVIGLACQKPSAAGGEIDVITFGPATGFSGLTAGNVVYLLDDGTLTVTFNGGLAANGDLAAGDFVVRIGYVLDATTIFVSIQTNPVVLTA